MCNANEYHMGVVRFAVSLKHWETWAVPEDCICLFACNPLHDNWHHKTLCFCKQLPSKWNHLYAELRTAIYKISSPKDANLRLACISLFFLNRSQCAHGVLCLKSSLKRCFIKATSSLWVLKKQLHADPFPRSNTWNCLQPNIVLLN